MPSPRALTEADLELIRQASAQGARPATDDVCQYCGDYGIRPATKDDLPYMQLDEFALGRFKAGDPFNVPCEHCKDKRRAKFIAKWQTKSRLTGDECLITLDAIVTDASTPGTAEVKKACQEMLDGKAFMLTLQGTSGNAKSIALIAVVNEFLKRGDSALYITLTDALDWIQDAFNTNGTAKEDDETALKRYQQLENVVMLALDEMQDAKESEWTLKILGNLVNRRQREAIAGNCYSILCTNKDVDLLPPQLLSRLRDGRNRTEGKPIIINNDKDLRPRMKRKARK